MKAQYAIRFSIPDHVKLYDKRQLRTGFVKKGETGKPVILEWGEELLSLLDAHSKSFDAVYPGSSVEIVSVPADALKAGTQTGSLINHIASSSVNPIPAVGMGATILSWTDRRAATITQVEYAKSGEPVKIHVVEDEARPLFKGMTDSQSYEYSPGTGPARLFTIRANGSWVAAGESAKGGQRISLGYRSHYHDFSF